MFLSEPAETPADLRFWLFGVHVRVHPFFWLISAILGWSIVGEFGNTRLGLIYLVVWVACVFVSVLVHELGHVFMGQLFGSHGHIVLHGFGGLAIGSNALNRGWQRFLVSFAGPLIQFVLLGLVLLAMFALVPDSAPPPRAPAWYQPVQITLDFLLVINLFWPLLNLLPIWPLDGGQMAREVLVGASPRNGVFLSFALSAVVAGLLAIHCLLVIWNRNYPLADDLPFDHLYLAIFFALFCAQSIMALQTQMPQRPRYRDDEFPWER